jgi:hypothetical protein
VYNARIGDTLQVMTALLDYSADIEAKEGGGNMSLATGYIDKALDNQYGDNPEDQVVSYLLKRGAKPHAIDRSGKHAIQRADERD